MSVNFKNNILHFLTIGLLKIEPVVSSVIHGIESKLSLDFDHITILRSPLFFVGFSFFTFLNALFFNNVVFFLLSVIYPFLKGVHILSEYKVTENILDHIFPVYHYFSLFSLFLMFDSMFSFITYFIPFYTDIKIIIVYFLIKNNFSLSSRYYNLLIFKINQFGFTDKCISLFTSIIYKFIGLSTGNEIQQPLQNYIDLSPQVHNEKKTN